MEEQKVEVEEHFNDTRKFPPQMAKYFTREYYQPGSGKVGLVYNALVDAEVTSETRNPLSQRIPPPCVA